MTKVKIISADDANKFQTWVNEFIKDKKVIDIKYQSYLMPLEFKNGVPCHTTILDRVLIIYEE